MYAALFTALATPAIAIDGHGVVVDANPAALRMLGRAAADTLSVHIHDVLHAPLAGVEIHTRDLCPVQPSPHEAPRRLGMIVVRADGAVLAVVADLAPLPTGGLLVTLSDHRQLDGVPVERRRVDDEVEQVLRVTVGPDGRIEDLTGPWELALGHARSDVVGAHVRSFIHDADLPAALARQEAHRAGLDVSLGDLRLLAKDGSVRTMEVLSLADVDANGQLVLSLRFRDVTEERAATAELETRDVQLQDAFEDANVGLFLATANAELTRVNAAYCRLLGRRPEQLIGRSLLEVTHPDDLAASAALRDEALRGDGAVTPFEKRYVRPDGTVVWALVGGRLVRDHDGRPRHIVGHAVDISALKQARERADRWAAQQAAVAELGRRALAGAELDELLAEAVDSVSRLLGHGPAAVLELREGSPVLRAGARPSGVNQLTVDIEGPTAPWGRLVAGGGAAIHSREHRDFLASLATVISVALADAYRDAVRVRAAEHARQAATGQLAAGLAHDLSNVIAGARLAAELIADDVGLPDSARERLAVVVRQLNLASDVCGRFINDLCRPGGEVAPLDLASLVRDAGDLLRRTLPARVRISVETGEAAPFVVGDRVALHEVLLNLATNSVDAMPGAGSLRFRVHPCEERSGTAGVRLSVCDDGEGIPPEVLPRVFEPFVSTKPPGRGTGLGLAQVRRIVDEHGGTVQVRSEPGVGTEVHLWLPAASS